MSVYLFIYLSACMMEMSTWFAARDLAGIWGEFILSSAYVCYSPLVAVVGSRQDHAA